MLASITLPRYQGHVNICEIIVKKQADATTASLLYRFVYSIVNLLCLLFPDFFGRILIRHLIEQFL